MNWRPPGSLFHVSRDAPEGPIRDPSRTRPPQGPTLTGPMPIAEPPSDGIGEAPAGEERSPDSDGRPAGSHGRPTDGDGRSAGSDGRPPSLVGGDARVGDPRVRERLERAHRLLICLDFDGTLAPIAADPDEPELTAANRRALEALTERESVDIAIVSGRALADVRSRVPVDGLDYAGNHGIELQVAGETSVHPLAAAKLPTLRRVRDELTPRLAPLAGCELEDKRLTLTVHTRNASAADAALARRRTETVVSAVAGDDLRIETGKRVLELLPAIPTGKDLAVRLLRESATGDPLVVYVGDDTADEAAFRAASPDGMSVHVGDGYDTMADYRLPDPSGVARFLRWLAELRSRR